LEGVALKPELNQDDGIHPNEKGTVIVSDTLTKSIISFIKE
jgi:acyl-CoA thioesterase-1